MTGAEVFASGIVGWASIVAFLLLLVAMVLAFVRIWVGPSFADRVIAIDLLTILLVAICAVYAIKVDEAAFLDIAIALALVAFLGTVALARYGSRRDQPPSSDDAPGTNADHDADGSGRGVAERSNGS